MDKLKDVVGYYGLRVNKNHSQLLGHFVRNMIEQCRNKGGVEMTLSNPTLCIDCEARAFGIIEVDIEEWCWHIIDADQNDHLRIGSSHSIPKMLLCGVSQFVFEEELDRLSLYPTIIREIGYDVTNREDG